MTMQEIKDEGKRLKAVAVAVVEVGGVPLPFYFHQSVGQAREFCQAMSGGSSPCKASFMSLVEGGK